MPNIPSDSVAPFFPLCAWLGRRSPAAAAASVASFSDINGSFACRIKYRSFCDCGLRSPRLSSASSSSFRSFLPSTVNSGVLYVAAFTVNSSEVMSANRVRPFFISEPGLKWMGVWEFVSVGFGDFMFDLVRVVGCPWSMGGWLVRTRAPVVFLDVPRVYPPHRLAPEGLGARNGSVGAVLRELPVPLRPREKLGGVRLRGRRRCRHPGRCRGRRDRVRAISHGRNRRPRALDDRARARGRRERRLESAERRGGGPRRATSPPRRLPCMQP